MNTFTLPDGNYHGFETSYLEDEPMSAYVSYGNVPGHVLAPGTDRSGDLSSVGVGLGGASADGSHAHAADLGFGAASTEGLGHPSFLGLGDDPGDQSAAAVPHKEIPSFGLWDEGVTEVSANDYARGASHGFGQADTSWLNGDTHVVAFGDAMSTDYSDAHNYHLF